MIMLRRRSIAGRAAIFAAVIGVLALTSLPGASATLSASRSTTATVTASVSASSTASAEGDTKCVPWGKGGLGLKCTGTYSGNTAFDPWIPPTNPNTGQPQSQNLPASDQPTVTISQAKDLTDQVVQLNWSNFTPSLGFSSGFYEPNPVNELNSVYQVSLLECNGTNPDWSDGYTGNDCYTRPVGSANSANLTQGPPNATVADTLDTSASPSIPSSNLVLSPYSPIWSWLGVAPVDPTTGGPLPCVSYTSQATGACSFDGGSPATWTGQADFHVEAPSPSRQGGFFNCGPSTPCSLVIDPNWGGTPICSAGNGAPCSGEYTNQSGCETHDIGGGFDIPNQGDLEGAPGGSTPPYGGSSSPAQAVTGSGPSPASVTQNSGACWTADRIVIPLSFAPTTRNCPGTAPQFYAAGSPMMQTQMLQWKAGWCTGQAPVTLSYNFEADESTAREDFLGGARFGGARIDMALVTLPPDAAAASASSRKFTYAPLANSGTGIAYYVDDGTTGSQIGRMVLNARLLAKLTTESYTLGYDGCASSSGSSPPQESYTCDPAVLNNPVSLFDDPEFLSLNQDCQPYGWSTGNYACMSQHPASSTYETQASSDFPSDNNINDAVTLGGFLPTVLQPDSDMTYDMTGWIAADQDATEFLDGKTDPWGMHVNNNYLDVSLPVSVFGLLDNGWTNPDPKCAIESGLPDCTGTTIPYGTMQEAWRPQLDLDTITSDLLTGQPTADTSTAQCSLTLCTSVEQLNVGGLSPEFFGSRALLSELDLGDIANYDFPAAELVNAAGKAVGPTQASVEAAVNDMKTNPDGITQYFDYTSTDPNAYPLAMVDYAMVPTCGLSSSEASAIADFLTKVATTGQAQGQAPGQLGAGYYPLTAKQKAQTLAAAAEVKAQDCKSVPLDKTVGGQHVNDTTPAQSGRTTTTTPASPKKKAPSSAATPTSGAANQKAQTAAFGQKSPDSGLAGILLLLAIVVGALLLIGGPAVWAITATGKWPVVLRWLRPVQAWLRAAVRRA
jgi:hypothetical protein